MNEKEYAEWKKEANVLYSKLLRSTIYTSMLSDSIKIFSLASVMLAAIFVGSIALFLKSSLSNFHLFLFIVITIIVGIALIKFLTSLVLDIKKKKDHEKESRNYKRKIEVLKKEFKERRPNSGYKI